MTVKTKKTKWLRISNKALSGILFLLGFRQHPEENEAGEVIPMYGMPASVYKTKNKTVNEPVEVEEVGGRVNIELVALNVALKTSANAE